LATPQWFRLAQV